MYLSKSTESIWNLLTKKIRNSNQPKAFSIPDYQREYSWTATDCETLFQDMRESDVGYYIGTMLLVSKQGKYDVIDGQQRLTSICLLLLALYGEIETRKRNKTLRGFTNILNQIKNILVCDENTERVKLQDQNNNYMDWHYLLWRAKLIKGPYTTPKNHGNRRISRNYSYFVDVLKTINNDDISELFERIRSLNVIPIEVDNVNDAYQLFEAMNTRGLPLRAIDIIKGKYLKKGDVANWNTFINNIGGNPSEQEQYLRYHYNAFKSDYKNCSEPLPSRAIRSNLIGIYDKLIEDNAKEYIERGLFVRAPLYGEMIGITECGDPNLKKLFANFRYAQATSAFMLVLYLYSNQNDLGFTADDLTETLDFLLKYFIRRNVTGFPSTGSIPGILQEIIVAIENVRDKKNSRTKSESIKKIIFGKLREKASTNESLKVRLSGDIYQDNSAMARYLLYMLSKDDEQKSNEMQIDFWAKTDDPREEKRRYKWTIEHILPQNKELCTEWVEMLANGDHKEAREIQDTHVHKIGNLTLTGYNSSLSDSPFLIKRDKKDSNERAIGFNNGISLNTAPEYGELCKKTKWTKSDIEKRTENMVKNLMKLLNIGLRTKKNK